MKAKLVAQITLVLLVIPFSVEAQLASQEWGKRADGHRIHAKADHLDGLPLGPFAVLPDGNLISVEDSADATTALVSSDDGKTWEKIPIFRDSDRFKISYERALICTREGTVIVSFMNLVERANWK